MKPTKLSQTVGVRLSFADLTVIRAKAAARGQPVSVFMREAALKAGAA